ncbi:hypothetical protein [Streptomyces marispadix]|uniref:Integral membrane protein n=1 Tax=Streptomyces marispadix TaxID=2922868 RepID=A0ABS9SYE5_9ACTN|nr:hypothetical protein [Streptomyces marispadix]MCH6161228.1 hypothetical protein [Streptomyces marispadix]
MLRIRGAALALALLPAAGAVIVFAAETTGRVGGPGWAGVRVALCCAAVLALATAAGVAAVIARSRPAVSPTVPVEESAAADLYELVRDLAERLEVPVPSAVALTPDCDSWLEDRSHRTRERVPPVLVIGSPFLWWMRVAELRALLAPVVAGTGPSAHPDIAAARRFVRGLDAAVAVADKAQARREGEAQARAGEPHPGSHTALAGSGKATALAGTAARARGAVHRALLRFAGFCARLMLRACAQHAAEMERGVAAAAASRAQGVDHALRTAAQEQVGLAYAGWDRLLTRVALPAWRIGRWPARLDAGVVSALTELSHRDRLAEGFTSRLGERPACDLLDEPGAVDEAVSLLAARLFHGGPAEAGPDWAPVDWQAYPEEVVDRIWRARAARLFTHLDALDRPGGPAEAAATPVRILEWLAEGGADRTEELAARIGAAVARESARESREEALVGPLIPGVGDGPGGSAVTPMGLPLQAPRTGRELMTEHITAVICCAAVDTAGAAPGLDWLDGPALLVDGVSRADLTGHVLGLVEEGDSRPLRDWMAAVGVRPDKPVRLV